MGRGAGALGVLEEVHSRDWRSSATARGREVETVGGGEARRCAPPPRPDPRPAAPLCEPGLPLPPSSHTSSCLSTPPSSRARSAASSRPRGAPPASRPASRSSSAPGPTRSSCVPFHSPLYAPRAESSSHPCRCGRRTRSSAGRARRTRSPCCRSPTSRSPRPRRFLKRGCTASCRPLSRISAPRSRSSAPFRPRCVLESFFLLQMPFGPFADSRSLARHRRLSTMRRATCTTSDRRPTSL